MNVFSNVNIPVFAGKASQAVWTDPSSGAYSGVYFSDADWLNSRNAIREQGATEGIARSVDFNTVMRQCTVMARIFANILAYRNSLTRSGQGVPYGGSASAPIGTELLSSESDLDAHIGAISDIFNSVNFLADNEVVTRTIASAAVTEVKLATGAVTNSKILDGAVTKSKLGSDLVNTGSASANGITVTLKQTASANNHGFVIGISGTKVTNASQADSADESDAVKTNTTTSKMYLCGTTSVTANTYKQLFNTSSVYISGGTQLNATDFNVTSDARLKENIKPVSKRQVRAIVDGVDVKSFNYLSSPERTTLGVMAQDLKKANTVLGDILVFEDSDGMLGIHENKLVYLLWDYVKQLNSRVLELEEVVKKLGGK